MYSVPCYDFVQIQEYPSSRAFILYMLVVIEYLKLSQTVSCFSIELMRKGGDARLNSNVFALETHNTSDFKFLTKDLNKPLVQNYVLITHKNFELVKRYCSFSFC